MSIFDQAQLKELRKTTHQKKMPLVCLHYPANQVTYDNNAYFLVMNYNLEHPESDLDPAQFIKQVSKETQTQEEADRQEKVLIDALAINLTQIGLIDSDQISELVVDFYRQSGIMCSQVKHNVKTEPQQQKEHNDSLLVCAADAEGKAECLRYLRQKNILAPKRQLV